MREEGRGEANERRKHERERERERERETKTPITPFLILKLKSIIGLSFFFRIQANI